MEDRNITVQDVAESLVVIRDQIITDENIDTVVGIVQQMTSMLYNIYEWIRNDSLSDEDISDIDDPAKRALMSELKDEMDSSSRSLSDWVNVVKSLFEKTKSTVSDFNTDNLINAIEFIQMHLRSSDDMLKDIITLFNNLHVVQNYQGYPTRSVELDHYNVRELFHEFKEIL